MFWNMINSVIYSCSVTVLAHILIILEKKHLTEQNIICFYRKSSNQIAFLHPVADRVFWLSTVALSPLDIWCLWAYEYRCIYVLFSTTGTTNMSSSPVHTRYCGWRPQQIWPPAQYIQGIVSAGHNKYVLQPCTYKVLCLQATTNMTSSPVHTKSCVCNSLYLLGWRIHLLWSADTLPCTYWAGGLIGYGLQTLGIISVYIGAKG